MTETFEVKKVDDCEHGKLTYAGYADGFGNKVFGQPYHCNVFKIDNPNCTNACPGYEPY